MWELDQFVLLDISQVPLTLSISLHFPRAFANVYLGDTDSFQVNHVYKDVNTYTVVYVASEVLGESVHVTGALQPACLRWKLSNLSNRVV